MVNTKDSRLHQQSVIPHAAETFLNHSKKQLDMCRPPIDKYLINPMPGPNSPKFATLFAR